MAIEYKDDGAAARRHWEAFWNGSNERPLFQAITPRSGVKSINKPRPYDCAFGELDPLIDQTLGWAATHEFLADSIPSFMITFAPDHFAALLGAEIVRSESSKTNWVEPNLQTLEGVDISFQRNGKWWERTVECVERFRQACDEKLIITGTHLQGSLDCLVALYGTQPLLLDMAMKPEVVKAALAQVDAAMREVRSAMADILDIPRYGSLNRFGMYSAGIIDVPQCDVSCMISKEMFDEFERPYLTSEVECTQHAIYHLDGPDALQHTETLCGIEALDMIQWMPGEGYYEQDWRELNQKIDRLGKGQIFQSYYNLQAADIVEIWESFSSRKLFFHVTPEQLSSLPWF